MTKTREHDDARTIVAVFTDRSESRDAARELHDAGYKHTWIGTTRPQGPTDDAKGTPPGTLTGEIDGTDVVQGGGGNVFGKIGRFFAGADYTLFEALRDHGVADADAVKLEESIPAGSSVLMVALDDDDRKGSDDPATVIARCGGRLLTSDAGLVNDDQLERREARQRKGAAGQDDVQTFHEEFFTERRVPR